MHRRRRRREWQCRARRSWRAQRASATFTLRPRAGDFRRRAAAKPNDNIAVPPAGPGTSPLRRRHRDRRYRRARVTPSQFWPKTRPSFATACASLPRRRFGRWFERWMSTPRSRARSSTSCSTRRDGDRDPRELRRLGGSFFHAVLAVEALSRVDPSIGVLVDVQNTLVINALLRWGTRRHQARYLPRRGLEHRRRVCAVGSRLGKRRVRAQTRARPDGEGFTSRGANSGSPTATRPTSSSSLRRSIRRRPSRHHGRFLSSAGSRLLGRQEGGQAWDSRQQHLRTAARRMPGAARQRARRARQGYKVAIETLNEGRIGIGAQMIGLAQSGR